MSNQREYPRRQGSDAAEPGRRRLDTGLPSARSNNHDSGPRSTAAGLASDTPIPTTEGWTALGELRPGQRVFDDLGEPREVCAVHPQGERPLLRVDMDDGSSVLAAGGQGWCTLTHHDRSRIHRRRRGLRNWSRQMFPMTTDEVRQELLHVSGGCIESLHSVPLPLPLQLPPGELPIDPYLLGLWLGDGDSMSAVITCHQDDEPHYRIRAQGAGENWRVRPDRRQIVRCSLAGEPEPRFLSRLRALGVKGNKHIPTLYLRASQEQRLHLLWGLMDSDGAIGTNSHAEYTSKSGDLARGVLELALSLGQKATLRKGQAKLHGRVVSDKYRVHFMPTCQVANLPRKADRLTHALRARRDIPLTRLDQRYIRGVEPAGLAEVTSIAVKSASGMFLAGAHMVPVPGLRPTDATP